MINTLCLYWFSVCWSTPRQCEHILYCVNQAGLPLGQVTGTPMFYCNTCGKHHM